MSGRNPRPSAISSVHSLQGYKYISLTVGRSSLELSLHWHDVTDKDTVADETDVTELELKSESAPFEPQPAVCCTRSAASRRLTRGS